MKDLIRQGTERKLLYITSASSLLLGLFIVSKISLKKHKDSKHPKHNPETALSSDGLEIETLVSPLTRASPSSIRKAKYPRVAPVTKICLTGGPCAGKTTALSYVSRRLTERGYNVHTVLEIATMTFEGGGMLIMDGLSPGNIVRFVTLFAKILMSLEDYFVEMATLSGKPSVILCDRGAMDAQAYMSEEGFQAMIDEEGWTAVNLRDQRYDGVIHLISAADGAEEFYTLEGNNARHEGLEAARALDQRLINAWIAHPNFMIIENKSEKGFERKLARTHEAVLKLLGDMPEKNINKRYLLCETNARECIPVDLKYSKLSIEDILLSSNDPDAMRILRRRDYYGECSFSIRTYRKNTNQGGDSLKSMRLITASEYVTLRGERNTVLKELSRERIVFVWENKVCIVDTFANLKPGFSVLHYAGGRDEVPKFIRVARDVSDDANYSTLHLLKGDALQKDRILYYCFLSR